MPCCLHSLSTGCLITLSTFWKWLLMTNHFPTSDLPSLCKSPQPPLCSPEFTLFLTAKALILLPFSCISDSPSHWNRGGEELEQNTEISLVHIPLSQDHFHSLKVTPDSTTGEPGPYFCACPAKLSSVSQTQAWMRYSPGKKGAKPNETTNHSSFLPGSQSYNCLPVSF